MPVGVQSRPSNFSMEIYFVKSISVSIERIHSTTSPFYSYVTWNFFDTNILDKKITSPLNWAYIMIYVPLKIFWGQHFGWNILRTVFLTRNWLRLLSIGICLTIFFVTRIEFENSILGKKMTFPHIWGIYFNVHAAWKYSEEIFCARNWLHPPIWGKYFNFHITWKYFEKNILCKKLTTPPYLGQHSN